VTEFDKWLSEGGEEDSVEILRARLRAYERRVRELRGGTALLVEAVGHALAGKPRIAVPPKPRASRKKREEVAVLHMSDLHIGAVTETHDTEIARGRARRVTEKVLAAARDRRDAAKVDRIHVYWGGDIVEGEAMRASQPWHIETGLLQQAMRDAPEILAEQVAALSESFREVKVLGVAGNHGRNGAYKSQTAANPETNWDRVAYQTARILLSDLEAAGRVEFDLPKAMDEFAKVDSVLGWGQLLVHGDQIRSTSGMPWYGFKNKALGWIDTFPEWKSDGGPFRFLWSGHFHTLSHFQINNTFVLSNGTFKTGDPFAQAQLAGASNIACQRLAFFDRAHGLVADYPLHVS
jgi:hypothetical protein